MSRQVVILQDSDQKVLAVEGSLKKIAEKNSDQVLSYRQLQRLLKKARENGKSFFTFKGKGRNREVYRISWWSI